MACFSDEIKHKCSKFVMVVSILLILLGIVTLAYGYFTLSGDKWATPSGDYDLDFSQAVAGLILIAGLLTVLTGCLGMCTGKFKKVFFTLPFMILTFIIMILCFAAGAMALAEPEDITDVKNVVCDEPMKLGGEDKGKSLADYTSESYTALVDKWMCSSVCPCDGVAYAEGKFTEIPESDLNKSQRTLAGTPPSSFSAALSKDYLMPMDATGTVKNYETCYNETLKAEMAKLSESDSADAKNILEFQKEFFENGGFELFAELEEEYECASLCSAPLFYLTKDINAGSPPQDCVQAGIMALTGQTGVGAAAVVTGLLLLVAFFGSIPLCTGFSKKD